MPGIPTDKVRAMQSQGFDNSRIIDALLKQGHSSSEINEAFNQVMQKPGTDLNPPQTAPPAQEQPTYQDHVHESSSYEVSNTEEMVEAIIDEKWNELLRDINKIIDWKNETEAKVIALEQKFDMLKDQFDKLHQAVIGKVGEYDKHILDVGAEVKAMEQVFSRVLPAFTENVHELQRITDKMKPNS